MEVWEEGGGGEGDGDGGGVIVGGKEEGRTK